ncbi:MAG: ABC transporter permease [Clostridioides sp.]|jgi:oligopeptide transport system permease protein|nr:ABC transporter permease [Clostridioides sp.]
MEKVDNSKFEIIGCKDLDAEAIVRPSITYWQDAWRRLKKNKLSMTALCAIIFIAVMTIIGPHLTKFGFDEQIKGSQDLWPSATHWFGTELLGRDIFARIWVGGRISMIIALVATFIDIFVGTMYGGISGYFGGLVDDIMMRIVEILQGIPYLVLVILLKIVLGGGSIFSIILAMTLTGWTGIARLVRGQVLQIKEQEYVLAAKALGASPMRIVVKHLIPNTIGVMIVAITQDIPSFIFAESFLSFLGLGVQSPMTSWGAMASLANPKLQFYPYQLFFPAMAISITMLSFNVLGDGLRDALDPKLRQ